MPRTTSSASSASKPKTTTVESKVGRPNQTVAAMKEEFAHNEALSKINFDKAQKALRQYKDPNVNSSYFLNSYTRETIREYLKNPAGNEKNLRDVARYLYYRSQILYRLVHWYAGMWDLRCRNVEPTFDLEQGLDSNVLKNYNETLKWLDIYNLQENLYEVFVNCYLFDVCYFLWFKDETGAIPYVLDPADCKIVGRYMSMDFSFAIDMSKWKNRARQTLIEFIGEPLQSMYREYERSGIKWVVVPDEYAGCFKFDPSNIDLIVPPFAPMFQTLSSLLDTEDLAAVQSKLDVFKLITMPLKTMGKTINDWEIDPELALQYFNQMVNTALPDYISAAPIPGEGLDVIDFSNASSDAQVDRVANAQKNIFSISGGGAVLNSNMINSTAALNAWLKEETDFAISSLIGQVDGFANRMLSYDVSNPCKVKHFEISEYTKEDFRKAMLEMNQNGFMERVSLATLYGISEKSMLASLHFEQEILGLQNDMVFPLQTSYTQTSVDTDPVTGGRPKKDDKDLSPSGDASRNE